MSTKRNGKTRKRPPKAAPNSAEARLFDEVRIGRGRNKRWLSDTEAAALIQLMAIKGRRSLDFSDLVPPGSFLARILRHFKDTDISHAIPFIGLLTIAASKLTQLKASVAIPGVGNVRPTVWNCILAPSGSAKTLAIDEVLRILSEPGERSCVDLLPDAGSDAQWIAGLEGNNGALWYQDEVGKYFHKLSRDKNLQRMKPWLLDAYSHKPISNTLKTATSSMVEDPHFTFLGMTVTDTWNNDIAADSMLDGFAQRFMYTLAPPRADCDMFDFLLYFEGNHIDGQRAEMREIWRALCAQPGAAGPYELNDEVLPYLCDWWRRLRHSWGKTSVPGSFMRRIAFAVFRYLPVIHFLLGKCRWKVDVESAEICTRICEMHFQSTLEMLDSYSPGTGVKVRKIAAIRENLVAKTGVATARDISRRLSASQRKELPGPLVTAITEALNNIEDVPDLIDETMPLKEKSDALIVRYDEISARLTLNTRKRNERRLREVMRAYRAGQAAEEAPVSDANEFDAAGAAVVSTNGDGTFANAPLADRSLRETPEANVRGMKGLQAKPGWSIIDDIEEENDDVIDHHDNVYQLPLPFAVR